jgi:hypothetical protein
MQRLSRVAQAPEAARSAVPAEAPLSRRYLALLVLLNLIFIVVFLVSRVEEHIEGMWSLKLGRCYVDYHTSIQSVGLACPGVDYIRLWPMVQPWLDPTDWPRGRGGMPKRGV